MDVATDAKPQLDLSFVRHPVRGTFLDRRVFRWPFTISRSFHLDREPAGMLTLILQTVSGSIQADDILLQRLAIGEASAVHVTTQGATPVHRAPPGMEATDSIFITIEDRGFLEYLPEPRILFPDSSLSQRVEVRLGCGAYGVVSDAFVLHDPLGRKRGFRHFASEVAITTREGALLALDRIDLDASPPRIGGRARYVAHGTLIIAFRTNALAAQALAEALLVRTSAIDGLYGASSPLPNDAGVAFRLAAVDGRRLKQGLRAGWIATRLFLFGCEPARRGKPD